MPCPLRSVLSLLSLALLGGACAPQGGILGNSSEVISRVVLTFTPASGDPPLAFEFDDPDGDGGVSGTAESIVLPVSEAFVLDLQFLNTLVDPPQDLTEEIAEEAEEHFVFVLGEGVSGPASTPSTVLLNHAYDDLESDYGSNDVQDDLPVGLRNAIETRVTGAGELRIVLRHLPALGGSPQKTSDLPEALAAGQTLPGDVDVDVAFELGVQ